MHWAPASMLPGHRAFGYEGISRIPFVFAFLFVALGGRRPGEAVAQSDNDEPTSRPVLVPGEEVAHWSGLPIWGEKEAREAGYELPLPLGLSGNVFYENANFRVPKLTIGGRGGGLLDIGGLVRVPNVHIEETATTMRFDAWVLPFLDLYAVGGYVQGHGDVELRPAVFGPKYDFRLNFNGPTVGVGGTLAAGFRPVKERSTTVFGLTDLNFTRTYLDFNPLVTSLDGVNVVVFSTRLGVRERILKDSSLGDVHLSLWAGCMYQGVQEVMEGSVSILDLNFNAHVQAVDPWSTIVGGRLEIGRNTFVTVEAGFGDRKSLMLAVALRF